MFLINDSSRVTQYSSLQELETGEAGVSLENTYYWDAEIYIVLKEPIVE